MLPCLLAKFLDLNKLWPCDYMGEKKYDCMTFLWLHLGLFFHHSTIQIKKWLSLSWKKDCWDPEILLLGRVISRFSQLFVGDKDNILLYEHQWNTRWAFARKLDIFTFESYMLSSHVKITRYLNMWKDHRCYGCIINRTFHTKKLLKYIV